MNFLDMYLEEMRAIDPIEEEELEMILAGTAAGEQAARNRLVEGSLVRALELARDYRASKLSQSDLVQEANEALLLAAVEYDGSQKWEELLERRVREALELAVREQEEQQEVGELMAARVNVLQTVSQMMVQELGREATVPELAEKMKMTEEEIRDLMKLALDALTVDGGV